MATKKTTTSAVSGIETLKHELYVLSMKKLSGELKETHKLKSLRKQIARALTSENTL